MLVLNLDGVELLYGMGWPGTGLKSDHLNLEPIQTISNPARNRFYWIEGRHGGPDYDPPQRERDFIFLILISIFFGGDYAFTRSHWQF